jgi:spore coat protein A
MATVAGLLPTGAGSGAGRSAVGGGVVDLGCVLPEAAPSVALAAGAPPRAFVAEPHTLPLALPRVADPVRSSAAGDAYVIEVRAAAVPLVPGAPLTQLLTYDGAWPGPTVHARVGRPVEVTFRNRLDRPAVVHLHGGHTDPASDGHPSDEIPPGGERTYRYPNTQAAATLWYHDHVMHMTGEHVYRGLAGFYLLGNPAEDALGLPSGDHDLPLLLSDRRIDADGQLVYDHNSHGGAFGDIVFVNGVAHPVHATNAAPLRLRLLNGSNSRVYDLRIDDPDVRMIQVASDGGLLARPVERTAIRLSPAERVEVVLDLSAVAGRSVHLRDAAALEGEPTLLRLEVGGAGAASAVVPAALAPIPGLGEPAVTREVRLSRDAGGHWQLNGANYDPARIDYRPRRDVTERWRITNDTLTQHPVHLHLAQFQVQTRNGAAVPPEEQGWKDTVLVPGRGVVELLVRFTGHTGTFVYHCHNLEHEDHDMMAQFRVVALDRVAGAGRLETAAAISASTFAPGAPVAYVATGAGFADALTGGPAAARQGGPVLLTIGSALAEATRAELQRLRPARIVVLGGEEARCPPRCSRSCVRSRPAVWSDSRDLTGLRPRPR